MFFLILYPWQLEYNRAQILSYTHCICMEVTVAGIGGQCMCTLWTVCGPMKGDPLFAMYSLSPLSGQ